MCKSTITVCTVHVHRILRVCANTYTRTVGANTVQCVHTVRVQTVSVNQWEQRKNGKYKYANTRVLLLMHATKVSCNVILYWKYQYADIPLHCTARWEVSPLKCVQTQCTQSTIMLYTSYRRVQNTIYSEWRVRTNYTVAGLVHNF